MEYIYLKILKDSPVGYLSKLWNKICGEANSWREREK
jgi:hypothetical protein